jgi:hypothetical protein
MKVFTMAPGLCLLITFSHLEAIQPPQTRHGPQKAASEAPAVTIWILRYERLDASPLSDEAYLPKKVAPARAKLKAKGLRRTRINFGDKQLALWFAEGNQQATLQNIQAAFPGLQLKLVAKAVFPEDS